MRRDSFTPFVHELTIRAQISGALPLPANSGSKVLMYMIFAMGQFDLATNEEGDGGFHYYEVTRAALQHDQVKEGSFELVQGLAIMANYLQRSN